MGEGEEEVRDNPSEDTEAVSADEAIRRIFGDEHSGPEETMKLLLKTRKQIERGEFMVLLEGQIEKSLDIYLQAQTQILKARQIKEKITTLEMNDYGVRFFIDHVGNLSIEGHPKKPAGFLPGNE